MGHNVGEWLCDVVEGGCITLIELVCIVFTLDVTCSSNVVNNNVERSGDEAWLTNGKHFSSNYACMVM